MAMDQNGVSWNWSISNCIRRRFGVYPLISAVQIDQKVKQAIKFMAAQTASPINAEIYTYMKKKEALWVSGKYIKKNWRAAGLEPTTSVTSYTILTDGNC